MDDTRFDRLARMIGVARTRRATLRLVLASVLLGVAAHDGVAAKTKRQKRHRVRASQIVPCTNVCRKCAGKPVGPGANLSGCDFKGADFTEGVNLSSANVSSACFVDAELPGALFNGANASRACFQDANLTNASFRGANLSKATFCGAVLFGTDFRGSNLDLSQPACAAFVGCNTILPNGKPAVPCAANQTCCEGLCTNTKTDTLNCGACGVECGLCQTCQNGHCVNAPNNTIACDGSPLVSIGDGVVCANPATKGICQDGQCNCGFEIGVYDPVDKVCRCTPDEISNCIENGEDCCILKVLCSNGAFADCGNCPQP